jgi:hypothetical protein
MGFMEKQIREILEDMLVEFLRGKGASIVISEAMNAIRVVVEQN